MNARPTPPLRHLWHPVVALFLLVGCSKESVRCESGLCPSGFACNPDSGQCEALTTAVTKTSGLIGRLSAVRTADGQLGVAAFSADRKSLVWLRESQGDWQPSFLAGPAASAQEAPAGHTSAAVVDAAGVAHLAWRRAGDATLWYATQGPSGWQREQVTVAAAGTVGAALAIGIWQDNPVIAWRALDIQNVRVAHKVGDSWLLETLPPPAALPGDTTVAVDLGRSLALVVLPGGPAVAAYEATRGDLVLAVRGAQTWDVSRLAGVDPKSGADLGDVGMPVAAALGPASELVLAYRDRANDRVWLARSKAGVLSNQLVMDGQRVDPVHQTTRSDLLGTVLAVVVLPTGLAVVAAQDGSAMHVRVAAETPAGGFATYTVPGTLQAWPTLVVQPDATALCLWLDLTDPAAPGTGRLQRWAVPQGGE